MTTDPASKAGKLSPTSERQLLWLFMAVQFTLILDFMLLMPLGPTLIQQLGLSAGGFGVLVSCYSISSAVCGFSAVFWLDRVPRARLLIALYVSFIVATLGCALAPNAVLLGAARVVAGGSAGLMWAGVLACVMDVVPAQRRGDALGLVMSAYAVAAVLGVPFGLFVAAHFGWRAPFGVLALVSLLLVTVLQRALGRLPEGPEVSSGQANAGLPTRAPSALQSLRELLHPTFISGWALSFCVVSAGFLLIPYLGTFLTNNLGLQSKQLALVYLVGGATTFVTSRLVGRAVDSVGPVVCLAVLLLGTLVPHLGLTHLTEASFAHALLAFTLFMTLTSGRIIPTITLISQRVPPHLRARFMAVNTATTDVASGVASALGGVLLSTANTGELVGFGRVGILACAVSLFTLGVLALHQRTKAAPTLEGLPEQT